jgi:hypothetical protein
VSGVQLAHHDDAVAWQPSALLSSHMSATLLLLHTSDRCWLVPLLSAPPDPHTHTPQAYTHIHTMGDCCPCHRCPSVQGTTTAAVMLPTSTIDWQATQRQGMVTLQPQTIRLLLHELGHALHFVGAAATPADPVPTGMRLDALEVPSHLAQRAATDPITLKVRSARCACHVCCVVKTYWLSTHLHIWRTQLTTHQNIPSYQSMLSL